jgi:hypothetical protein
MAALQMLEVRENVAQFMFYRHRYLENTVILNSIKYDAISDFMVPPEIRI